MLFVMNITDLAKVIFFVAAVAIFFVSAKYIVVGLVVLVLIVAVFSMLRSVINGDTKDYAAIYKSEGIDQLTPLEIRNLIVDKCNADLIADFGPSAPQLVLFPQSKESKSTLFVVANDDFARHEELNGTFHGFEIIPPVQNGRTHVKLWSNRATSPKLEWKSASVRELTELMCRAVKVEWDIAAPHGVAQRSARLEAFQSAVSGQ